MLISLLVVLFICAFFYEAARKRNNKRVMNIFIGIGAFFVGSVVATIIADILAGTILSGTDVSDLVYRLPLLVVFVWLTYRGLKSILNPSRKNTYKSSTLDGDLTDSEEETQQ